MGTLYQKLLWAAAAALVAAGGWWLWNARDDPGSEMASSVLVQNEPFEVSFSLAHGRPRAGQTGHVHVTVRQAGALFDLLEHGYAPHVIIASENYRSFIHTVEPVVDGPGVYGVDFDFAEAGDYRIWFEVDNVSAAERHGDDAALIAYADLTIEGRKRAGITDPFVRGQQAQAGPYQVVMDHAELIAGRPADISVSVRDETGATLGLLEDEPSIHVIVGNDFDFFRHGHTQPPREGKFIDFTETFPAAGEYIYWTQIYVHGQRGVEAVEVPFLLTVE